MSNAATNIYSTCVSAEPLGYCERTFRGGCVLGLYDLGALAEVDDWPDDSPVLEDGVRDFELEFEIRSVSGGIFMGGNGDLGGREY
jgi:hypothetical protein